MLQLYGDTFCRLENITFLYGDQPIRKQRAGTMTLVNCSFTQFGIYAIYLEQNNKLFLTACRFDYSVGDNGDAMIRLNNADPTILYIECCCFQTVKFDKPAINGNNNRIVIFSKNNCFRYVDEASAIVNSDIQFADGGSNTYNCQNCDTALTCLNDNFCMRVTVVLSDGDYEVEDCSWRNQIVLEDRVLEFRGRNLLVQRCRFENCGNTDMDGGCILAQSLAGDVFFGNLEFVSVYAYRGSIVVEGSLQRTVTLYECSVLYGHYRNRGFVCAGEVTANTQRLIVNVTKCSFVGLYIMSGGAGGMIFSRSPVFYCFDSLFENCTGGGASDQGFAMFVEPNSDLDRNVSIDRCTVDNKQYAASSSQVITIRVANTAVLSIISIQNSYLYWDQPGGTRNSPIYFTDPCKLLVFRNFTFKYRSTMVSNDLRVCNLPIATFEIVDCWWEHMDPIPVSRRLVEVAKAGTLRVENSTIIGATWGIYRAGAGALIVTDCNFSGFVAQAIYASSVQTLVIQRSTFTSQIGGTNTDGIIRIATSGSVCYLDCCCFQTAIAGQPAVQTAAGVTLKLGENCFSHADLETAIIGIIPEIGAGVAISYGCGPVCPTTCSSAGSGCAPIVRTVTERDNRIEDCTWEDQNTAEVRVLEFAGRNLAMLRCKFINCGSTTMNGGCILARAFTGDLLFDSVEFLHVLGQKGTIFVESTRQVLVSLQNCSLLYGTYSERGFLTCDQDVTTTQRLTVNVSRCSISGVSGGNALGIYGLGVYSRAPRLYITDTTFDNCTSTTGGNAGLCVLSNATSDQRTVTSLVRCTFDNGNRQSSS
jgi:hypothetical protein